MTLDPLRQSTEPEVLLSLLLAFLAQAAAPPPPSPRSCYDAVYIDLDGIMDAPTCWFVNGDGSYEAPEVTAGDIEIVEGVDGVLQARCSAPVSNESGHFVLWHSGNACANDPDVHCQIGVGGGRAVGTTDWGIVVTAGGDATLTCTYTPD